MPLLKFTIEDAPVPAVSKTNHRDNHSRKTWLAYAPLALAIFLILMPHPSYAIMTKSFYMTTLHSPIRFAIHLVMAYALSLLALTSLVVCAVRDPGSLTPRRKKQRNMLVEDESQEALLHSPDAGDELDGDERAPTAAEIDELAVGGRWCRHCWRARPERAHHCSTCDKCILKMDHHCPWLGGNCIGHRTYPAFLHFLFMCTALAVYITCVATSVIIALVADPFSIDPVVSPLHALFLALMSGIFSIVMASFLVYHIYLVSSNQTTHEHLSNYFLLRFLPPLSMSSRARPLPYHPPQEHELSHAQRWLVRREHGKLRLYDLGWRRNWGEVFGGGKWYWWSRLVLYGGEQRGNGWTFEKGEHVQERLERLARALAAERREERRGR
ncbi:DHHC palmitoyltransferase-domain-containing protein [Hysterangium stoloniferum]|nr:DHHC palmitoyltransferase-domain-containing protein [Hysterangium stoloniferum]